MRAQRSVDMRTQLERADSLDRENAELRAQVAQLDRELDLVVAVVAREAPELLEEITAVAS